jgi:mutator protein MutT
MSDDRTERMYPVRPMVGVGAVVWDGRRVLLERRGKPPAQGSWSLPGGLIEVGETAEAAVRREVMEECGITVTVGPILGLFEPIQCDLDDRIRYHFVVIDFLVYYHDGELRIGDDAADLRWVDPEDLPAYALNPATYEMIRHGITAARSRSANDGALSEWSTP